MVSHADINKLKQLNIDSLNLLIGFLSDLPEEDYKVHNGKGQSSIGQHVRHVIEFYECLQNSNNSVNYDLRKRDAQMETDISYALHKTKEVILWLEDLNQDNQLILETYPSGLEAESVKIPSTFSRELFHVLDHLIHHMAIIRVLVKDLRPEFMLNEQFGVAYSTMAHRSHILQR